ncbi:phosphonoacetaldehyde reductase [candidate division WOR-3 bacterium]|nr:phosphonoacetaldehyde reductase [candidate division WOR-3 bacterium]
MWKYYNPVKIIFTEHFDNEISEIVDINKKCLLLCSKRFRKSQNYEKIYKIISNLTTFTDIENNPSFNSCNKAIRTGFDIKPNTIIAIGGGSVIDTAKSVRMALYKNKSNLKELFERCPDKKVKPIFIAIPTTHGTSSELTMWATIWYKENKKKFSLSESNNYPDYAIYDVSLVKNLPIDISISTTLDALSHAFESIWNVNNNPISTNYAIQAIKLIFEKIDKLSDNTTIDVRKKLVFASMLSGLAFSNTATAAAHAISYPLTLNYNIPHGIACSMPLFALLELNYPLIQDEINNLLKTIHCESITDFIKVFYDKIRSKIPFKLRNYGVKRYEIHNIKRECFLSSRIENNIVRLDNDKVLHILEKIY